jgi:hypothetical protein
MLAIAISVSSGPYDEEPEPLPLPETAIGAIHQKQPGRRSRAARRGRTASLRSTIRVSARRADSFRQLPLVRFGNVLRVTAVLPFGIGDRRSFLRLVWVLAG